MKTQKKPTLEEIYLQEVANEGRAYFERLHVDEQLGNAGRRVQSANINKIINNRSLEIEWTRGQDRIC